MGRDHRWFLLALLLAFAVLLSPVSGWTAEPTGIVLGKRVQLVVTPYKLQRASGQLFAKLAVTNRTKQPIYGPLSILITATRPAGLFLADATGTNAAGQSFLTVDLPASGLAPRKRIANISLRFASGGSKKLKATYLVYGRLTPNRAPIAKAGAERPPFFVGDPVALDGAGSTDADGDALSYHWSLIKPPASGASLQ